MDAKNTVSYLYTVASPEELEKYYNKVIKNALEYGYNPKFDPRKIVGDNPKKLREKGYGNNDVKGPDAFHGTHVAGIIAANRENALGIKGVAQNVLIMPIRAVPDGDERDKDVANAIYYAVDNGAHIINMSFGKAYSPDKKFVDEAVRYAESKGVLLVHAAGNDAKNLEEENNFPNRKYADTGKEASNWLEIGASGWSNDNSKFVANFSNYGKSKVDVFAPGVDIYSTVPDKNAYKNASGTSMAAPATSGVAALIMSYYPKLTATQVKDILMKSSIKYTQKINKPGEKGTNALMTDLCISGGIVNAYEALKMAEEMSK
jgi:subtilisin family serine protease